MFKKALTITIIAIIAISGFAMFNIAGSLTYEPKKLQLYIGPTSIPADNSTYNCVFVQLQDVNSKPARALQDTTISLSSSSTNVGTVDTSVKIQKGKTYTSANFNSTNSPGITTITATATGFATVQSSISTSVLGSSPSKLAVFCVPQTLPSDDSTYPAIQVQLQDVQGRPTKAVEADLTVNLFNSQPEVGVVSATTLIIPIGISQVTGSFSVTNAPGSTIITAAKSNYTTGTATITTYLIDYSPLQITLTAKPGSINNGNNAQIVAYIAADGAPVAGAVVIFTSNNGGTFSAQQQGNGYYNTTFTAPNFSQTTTCTITASASKTGYLDSQGTTQVSVTPNAAPTPTDNNKSTLQLLIKDINDNPLNDTIVSSITQPAGMTQLFGITNATGYVKFDNMTAGAYTFRLVKQGYPPMNVTIDFAGQSLNLPLTLITGSNSENSSSLILIVVIAVVIFVVAAVTGLLLIKRRSKTRIRKLQAIQKQLKFHPK